MGQDVEDKSLLSPAVRVTWIGPQRPVEGGTVFVKPAVEAAAAETEATPAEQSV